MKTSIFTLIILTLLLGIHVAYAFTWSQTAQFPQYWGTAPNVLRETQTGNFTCTSPEWRITWNYTPIAIADPTNVYFNIFLYRTNDTVYYIAEMNQQGNTTTNGTWYITNQTGEFYLKFLVYNVQSATATVETPTINIILISPQNQNYNNTQIPLTYTLNETTSWIGYSLDRQANTTITGNTTLTTSEGPHNITIYANASNGYTGTSNTVPFIVDTTPPGITTVSQNPTGNIQPNQPVLITANISDTTSGIANVTLIYITNQSSNPQELAMTLNQTSGLYETTILVQEPNTHVKYQITAYDKSGNNATNDNAGQYYAYTVIPEIPPNAIITLFMTTLLSTALTYKRKNVKHRNREDS